MKRVAKMYRKYLVCTDNDHDKIDWFTVDKLYPVYLNRDNRQYVIDDNGDDWIINRYDMYFSAKGTYFKEVFK